MMLEGTVTKIMHVPEEEFLIAEHWCVTVMTPEGQKFLFYSTKQPALKEGDLVDIKLKKMSRLAQWLRGHEPWPWWKEEEY